MAYYLTFTSGSNSSINCGSQGGFGSDSVDNLIATLYPNGITFEAWIKPTDWGGSGGGRFFSKGQWQLFLDSSGSSFCGNYNGTVQDADSQIPFTPDGEWHHFAATFHYNSGTGGDRKWHLFIDGVEGSYSVQDSLSGALSDAANSLIIGNNFAGGNFALDGNMGWARIYNGLLYTSTFTPRSRCNIPTPDANTICLWKTDEGTGTTLTNSGFATANGSGSNCTWGEQSCTAAIVNVYAVELGDEGGDLITPMRGDRSAFDVVNFQELHANDIDTLIGIHHTLGISGSQAAPGNHTHVVSGSDITSGSDVPNGWVLTADGSGGADWVVASGSSGSSSGSGLDGHVIQNSGCSVIQRGILNFTGTGVSVTDNPSSGCTVVTITAGSSGSSSGSITLTVQELDGNPTINNVTTLRFPNGSVADSGSGIATITFSGSSSGSTSGSSGDGHITIMPYSYSTIDSGSWSPVNSANALMQSYWNNFGSEDDLDSCTYKVYLTAGTYSFLIYYHKNSFYGILDVDLAGSEITSIDCYASGATWNQRETVTGISIATSGIKDLTIRVDGKNASSAGYDVGVAYMSLWRTA